MEFEKLKKVIAEVLSVDPDEITMETTFTDDLGADSLDIFQIIMGLEEEFDIEIAPEKAENVKTVEEALELINEKTENDVNRIAEELLQEMTMQGAGGIKSTKTDVVDLGGEVKRISVYVVREKQIGVGIGEL